MQRSGIWVCAGLVAVLACSGTVIAAENARVADAAQRRNTPIVRTLLAQRVDVNVPQPDGATAIAWATHWDDAELADLLIRAGANVNTPNELLVTPLMLAAMNGSTAMIEKLLAAGADPKVARASGETALILAARAGSVGGVKTLVAHGADINAQTNGGDTALMFAASERHLDVVRTLVEGGADVKARATFTKPEARKPMAPPPADKEETTKGPTLLYKGQAIAVAQLPKDGDNDPPRPEGGFTPLLHAVMAGNLDIVRVLIAAGADVNDAAPDGMTPLILAITKHHEDVALFLIEKGASLGAPGPGFNALHAAAATGQMKVAKAMLAGGADPNAPLAMPLRLAAAFIPYNPDLVSGRLSLVGATPFMLAAKSVDTGMMRLLVEAGADPLKKANDGTTALIVAAGLGKRSSTDMFKFIRYYSWDETRAVEAIKLCLQLGIDINAANETGETALHGATYHAANDVIKMLVANGANINATNWSGQTPLRLAQGHFYSGTFVRYPETAQLYRQLGADPAAGVQLNFGLTQYRGDNKTEPK